MGVCRNPGHHHASWVRQELDRNSTSHTSAGPNQVQPTWLVDANVLSLRCHPGCAIRNIRKAILRPASHANFADETPTCPAQGFRIEYCVYSIDCCQSSKHAEHLTVFNQMCHECAQLYSLCYDLLLLFGVVYSCTLEIEQFALRANADLCKGSS